MLPLITKRGLPLFFFILHKVNQTKPPIPQPKTEIKKEKNLQTTFRTLSWLIVLLHSDLSDFEPISYPLKTYSFLGIGHLRPTNSKYTIEGSSSCVLLEKCLSVDSSTPVKSDWPSYVRHDVILFTTYENLDQHWLPSRCDLL